MKVGDLVEIKWIDAIIQHDDGIPTPPLVSTYGKVVRITPEYVSIAHEIFEDGTTRGVTSIPRILIQGKGSVKK